MENVSPEVASSDNQNVSNMTESEGNESTSNARDFVAYDTHRKLLSQRKKDQQVLDELSSKLKSYEQKEMETKGQQQQLIEALRKELSDSQKKVKEVQQTYAWNTMESQLMSVAKEHGCTRPDLLMKAMDDEDFAAVEVGENFKVNQEDALRFIDRAKDKADILFHQKPKQVEDLAPGSEPKKPKNKSLKDLPREDRIRMLMKQL